MECDNIKKIMPGYIRHLASTEQIASIEEHLCVCNDCRQFLAKMMDEFEEGKKPAETISSASLNIDDSEFKITKDNLAQTKALESEEKIKPAQPINDKKTEVNPVKNPISHEVDLTDMPHDAIIAKDSSTQKQPALSDPKKIPIVDVTIIIVVLVGLAFLLFLIFKN